MDTQFWWFFDAMALSAILISIYRSGKRGFSKTAVIIAGCVISLVLPVAAGGKTSGWIYDIGIKKSKDAKIEMVLKGSDMAQKTKNYIDSLGYGISTDELMIGQIFSSGGDITDRLYEYLTEIDKRHTDSIESFENSMSDGYAEIMENILEKGLSRYEASEAAEKIKKDTDGFNVFLRMMQNGSQKEAALYIEENYTASASIDIIRTVCFIIILFALSAAALFISNEINKSGSVKGAGEIAEPILGGLLGIAEGIMIIFLAAVLVKLLIFISSDEMMFFNSSAIEKTFLFKHIYRLAMKL